MTNPVALIVGAGSGLSASVARALAADGYRVVLAARNTDKLSALCDETGARSISCDATSAESVSHLFARMQRETGKASMVLYNPNAYTRGAIDELDPDTVHACLMQTVFGAFLVAQQATIAMKAMGGGALFFTGATASVKGFPKFSSFAMGKFALRGLAQSLARELGPLGIHVAHFIIDGGIASDRHPQTDTHAMLEPDAIAQTYLDVLRQHRSAWTHEIDLRPWGERF